jgi:HEAT repeat protein
VALGQIGAIEAMPALLEAMKDKNEAVRKAASVAVVEIDPKAAKIAA